MSIPTMSASQGAKTDVQEAKTERPKTLVNAVIGAVVTLVTSFIPFSPVIGGGVAGYLQKRGHREGARVGAIAGLIAAIPIALLVVVLFVFMGAIIVTPGQNILRAQIVFLLVLVAAVVVSTGIVVGLSAIGGFAGGYVPESRAKKAEADDPTADEPIGAATTGEASVPESGVEEPTASSDDSTTGDSHDSDDIDESSAENDESSR